ncbi:hypothetical protein BACI71_50048 [Bacillus mycoides]|uniref:Uncharacterized protein n=1 Tax=Bacillus mycoides TaxID=1405 RepID=A0A654AMK9_BACMY|nr:hypothetical protein BACI71_50048 [Bacillus mycoides]
MKNHNVINYTSQINQVIINPRMRTRKPFYIFFETLYFFI